MLRNSLRAGLVAIAVVVSILWGLQLAIQRVESSNRSVVHTAEVLASMEAVLGKVGDAQSASRSYAPTSDTRTLDRLDGVEGTIAADLHHLRELTRDNQIQQEHLDRLTGEVTRALAAFRSLTAAKAEARPLSPAEVEVERSAMDPVRRTMESMRGVENQLLAQRVQADAVAVRRLQGVSIGLAITASTLLGLLFWLLGRDGRRMRTGAEVLRRGQSDLEAEAKTRDASLLDTNARLESIINSAVDGIIVIDAKGIIESFNHAAERLFGYPAAEVIGRNVSVLMPSPYREEHDTYLARHLATGVQKIIGIGREVTGQCKDGRTFPLHLSVGKMMVGGEPKFTGIVHDLTARVQIEARLRDHTAMARLGEMAAVIAHEVKNPLAGVRGAIQVIGSRLPQDGRDAAIVKEIISRIDALNDLMKDLLLFARPPQPHPASVDLARLIQMTADLLQDDPALSQVQVEVTGSATPIAADPELLKIVFTNLLVNAAHAMQGAGTIRVSFTSTANSVQIAFADQGPGIATELLDKIFTPFFTTKARGSGLGLVTAKRIAEAHHGSITLACPVTGGTIVTVELPSTPPDVNGAGTNPLAK